MRLISLFPMLSALPGLALGASLRVNDTLNSFQIYGKRWVSIYGDGVTADSANIGSDRNIDQLNNNMKVGGSLISGDFISLMENIKVAGAVNCRGNLYLTATS